MMNNQRKTVSDWVVHFIENGSWNFQKNESAAQNLVPSTVRSLPYLLILIIYLIINLYSSCAYQTVTFHIYQI